MRGRRMDLCEIKKKSYVALGVMIELIACH